jgi:hypothetical protein
MIRGQEVADHLSLLDDCDLNAGQRHSGTVVELSDPREFNPARGRIVNLRPSGPRLRGRVSRRAFRGRIIWQQFGNRTYEYPCGPCTTKGGQFGGVGVQTTKKPLEASGLTRCTRTATGAASLFSVSGPLRSLSGVVEVVALSTFSARNPTSARCATTPGLPTAAPVGP